jgi:hypothetical protein
MTSPIRNRIQSPAQGHTLNSLGGTIHCVSLLETKHICQMPSTKYTSAALVPSLQSQGLLTRHSTDGHATSYPSKLSDTHKLLDPRILPCARRTSANHIRPITCKRADGWITITSFLHRFRRDPFPGVASHPRGPMCPIDIGEMGRFFVIYALVS